MSNNTGVPYDASITFLPTADLARTSQFYRDVLGLRLVVDQGTCHIYQIAQGGFIGFCQSVSSLPADDRMMLTFITDDVDGCYERLVAQGVSTDGAPRENGRYQIYHFFAADPNGYRLEIQRFLHPFP